MNVRETNVATDARLLLSEGGQRFSTLASVNGVVTIHRPRGDLETLFFMVPASFFGLLVIAGGMVALVLMSWIAVTEFSPLAMLMAAMFGVCSAIVSWVVFAIQGLVFPFKVTLRNGRYYLANGFMRLVRPCRIDEAEADISPVYMRGDWGLAARIRPGSRSWRWPLLPARVVGSKHEALQVAIKLQGWLRENTNIGRVELVEWGDVKGIRPNVEYIK